MFILRALQIPMCMIVYALSDLEVCQSGSEGLDWGTENKFGDVGIGIDQGYLWAFWSWVGSEAEVVQALEKIGEFLIPMYDIHSRKYPVRL